MAKLHEVEIHRLRPTQITVGLIEVHDKRDKLLSLKKDERQAFLQAHPMPAVWGPDDKLYITDHHHLGRACEAAVDTAFFLVEDDLSKVAMAEFWPKMTAAHWAHPIDQVGKPRPFGDIPNHLEKLVDDPYRSLAGYVRDAGASRRLRPHLPNSYGRTSSGRASRSGRRERNSTRVSRSLSGWQPRVRPPTCPATRDRKRP